MSQLILHLLGDYLTQSDWLAQNKTKRSLPAFVHALVYSLPFALLRPSPLAWSVIAWSHFFIDRFRLARYVVWAKNVLLHPAMLVGVDNEAEEQELKSLRWENCKATGYASERPVWMSVWLMIIADNTLHLAINYACLRWL